MSECCFREYRSGAGGGDTCCCLGDVFDVVQEGLVEGHVFHSSAADGLEWDDIGRDGDGTTRRVCTPGSDREADRGRENGDGGGGSRRESDRGRGRKGERVDKNSRV